MPNPIKLSQVLAELDEKILPDGKQKTFSVKFILNSGELVFLRRAVSAGAGKMNMSENAMRGFLAVDDKYEPIGHVYPVKIWHIINFNDQKVILK